MEGENLTTDLYAFISITGYVETRVVIWQVAVQSSYNICSLVENMCVNICDFFTLRSTKEFTKIRSDMSVHSRIELEFGNVGF